VAEAESGVADGDAPCGAQTILVVEDEDAVRRATVRALGTWGFTVLSAVHGQDALQVLAEHPEVDVVVSDVVMPVLDGYGLVARLREASNPVPVVLVSGYPDKMRHRRGAGSTTTPIPDLPIVSKPFTRAELVGALREAMRQRAPR
jgi:two-component system cell cycle sensor histidine kinase/response regulator CckA